MMRALFLAGVTALTATGAQAAICGPRDEVVASLSKRYQELPLAAGINKSGRLFEILVRRDGVSWTVLLTTPDGVSCIVDAGESLMLIDRVKFFPAA